MTREKAKKTEMIIGIDIGTTKIAAVLVRVDTESPVLLGIAKIPFSGLPFTDPDMDEKSAVQITSRAIERVVNEACEAADYPVKSAVIGISGFPESFCSQGVVSITKQVAQDDILRVLGSAASITLPNGLILFEQVIESFIVDEAEGIVDPTGMTGSRLEVKTHCILAQRSMVDTVTAACEKIGLNILKVTSSELAASEMLLTQEDKEHGVCLLDIGGDHASLVIFHAGAVVHSSSVPWGGNYLTERIKFWLGVNAIKAEKAKCQYSRGELNDKQSDLICNLLERELLVLCSHLDTNICKSGFEDDLKAGIVLTGGSSILPGIPETIERVLKHQVRCPQVAIEKWAEYVSLEYASALGLVVQGIK